LFPRILSCLDAGGVLVYETFMAGNERYGRPSNPEFLLRPGELLAVVEVGCQVVAFEQGLLEAPQSAMVQRVTAIKGDGTSGRLFV
jgi:hypothetical protein